MSRPKLYLARDIIDGNGKYTGVKGSALGAVRWDIEDRTYHAVDHLGNQIGWRTHSKEKATEYVEQYLAGKPFDYEDYQI